MKKQLISAKNVLCAMLIVFTLFFIGSCKEKKQKEVQVIKIGDDTKFYKAIDTAMLLIKDGVEIFTFQNDGKTAYALRMNDGLTGFQCVCRCGGECRDHVQGDGHLLFCSTVNCSGTDDKGISCFSCEFKIVEVPTGTNDLTKVTTAELPDEYLKKGHKDSFAGIDSLGRLVIDPNVKIYTGSEGKGIGAIMLMNNDDVNTYQCNCPCTGGVSICIAQGPDEFPESGFKIFHCDGDCSGVTSDGFICSGCVWKKVSSPPTKLNYTRVRN